MTGSIPPVSPLAYEGSVAVPYFVKNLAPLAPTTANNQFPVPTIWIDPVTPRAFILVAKPHGVADWILLTAGAGPTIQIDTPDGAHVMPVAGIINFLNGIGMNITGAGNNVTFNALGGGLTWNVVTGTTQAAVINEGYIANNAGLVTVTLPVTAAVGSITAVTGMNNATGWKIAQNAGQQIFFGVSNTMSGTGGSLASTNTYDSVYLVCNVANTSWIVLNSVGNITVV